MVPVSPKIKTEFLPLVFLTAYPAEAEAFFRLHPCQLIGREKKFHSYQLRPQLIFLLITGPGPGLETSSLEKCLKQIAPVLLINFGISGGLDPSLPLFQNFLISQVIHLDKPEISPEKLYPEFSEKLLEYFPACRLLTSNYPVLQETLRKQLFLQSGCQLVDTEGFTFTKVALKYSIPIILLKQLTDYCNENSTQSIRENRSLWQNSLQKGLHLLMGALSESSQ
jgi:nucleoside phosphorylase